MKFYKKKYIYKYKYYIRSMIEFRSKFFSVTKKKKNSIFLK